MLDAASRGSRAPRDALAQREITMWNRYRLVVVLCAIAAAAACGDRPAPTAPTTLSDINDATLAGSSGGTVKETLTGLAIGGVVPEGQALADQSNFLSGGSTTLTVQIKKVNLPDGTVLSVSLDFTPVGTITLQRQEGTLVTSLGHFAVSFDQVRVNGSGGTTILIGGFFQ
jgi:hypothetical protein